MTAHGTRTRGGTRPENTAEANLTAFVVALFATAATHQLVDSRINASFPTPRRAGPVTRPDETGVCNALVTADQAMMIGLVAFDLSVVQGSATDLGDGRWSAAVYATTDVIDFLTKEGFEVSVAESSDELRARWDAIQGQVE